MYWQSCASAPLLCSGINYDIEIVEQHHHNKLDGPSGTALMLADAINEENNGAYHYVYDRSSVRQKRDPKEIGISAVRGGSIVGDHEVLFCGPDEVINPAAYRLFPQHLCQRCSKCCGLSGQKKSRVCTIWAI